MSEEKKFAKIAICVLTTFERSGWPHPDMLDFIYSLRFNFDYATAFSKAHNFIPAAGARNFVCRSVKEQDIDWLLMIDNDMAPPMNLLDTIKNAPEDAAVVVPRFYLYDGDQRKTKLCWGVDESKVNANDVYQISPGFHELTKCGSGAIFIRPHVLKTIPSPWFWYTINEDQCMTATEDINFCLKVREHGFKIYGNADILVGHHHTVELSQIDEITAATRKPIDNPVCSVADSESKQAESPSDVSEVAAVSPTS